MYILNKEQYRFHQHFTRAFLYESVLYSFSLAAVRLCNFLAKEYRGKSLCKMLMKLTLEANPIKKIFFSKEEFSVFRC